MAAQRPPRACAAEPASAPRRPRLASAGHDPEARRTADEDRATGGGALSARVVGADGTRDGWIAVTLADGCFERAELCRDVEQILARNGDAQVVALDIPIGELTEPTRAADAAARAFLPGRASSVFPTPVYAALEASSYEEACRISVERTGKKLSKQSWELRGKIREATEAVREDGRIVEVHPEVSFAALNGGTPPPRKKTYNGVATRMELLRRAGIELPPTIDCGDRAPADDVLDAAVAAWSAERKRRGEARTLPEDGGELVIWY